MLRKIMYLFLILFFIVGSLAAYSVYVSINTTRDVMSPVGDFVRQLAIPATPVILPNPSVIVNQIQGEAELVTVSMKLERIVTAERNNEVLWGMMGESLLFVAHGHVEAGMDLSQLREEDIVVVDPDTVMINLPPARIYEDKPILDTDRSYIASRSTGLLTRADAQLETEVRRVAEQELLNAALDSELTVEAQRRGELVVEALVRAFGFTNIIFTDGPPPPVDPFEQQIPKGYILTPAPTAVPLGTPTPTQ
ncbi:MAG: DUF4230 domain-containing protein [Chloroflexota bacterium]